MTWRDKLEIGVTKDAAYRKDTLPASQIRGPEIPTGLAGLLKFRCRAKTGVRWHTPAKTSGRMTIDLRSCQRDINQSRS